MTRTATQLMTDTIDLTDRSIVWQTPEPLVEALAAFDQMIDRIKGASLGFTSAVA